jgi:hypothetical protein
MIRAYDFSEEISSLRTSTAFVYPTNYHYLSPPWDWDEDEPVEDSWSIALSGLGAERKKDWKPCTKTLYPLGYKDASEIPQGERAIELLDCTTLIAQGGRFYLALTKSGQDMRWEICNSYIRLGFLPPAYFAAGFYPVEGKGESAQDKLILAACRRSLVVVRDAKQRDLQKFLDRFTLELSGVRAVVG